jgi:hypothetical protein
VLAQSLPQDVHGRRLDSIAQAGGARAAMREPDVLCSRASPTQYVLTLFPLLLGSTNATAAGIGSGQRRDDIPTLIYPCQVAISPDKTLMACSDPIHHKIYITDLTRRRSKTATTLLTGNHRGFADGIAYHAVRVPRGTRWRMQM